MSSASLSTPLPASRRSVYLAQPRSTLARGALLIVGLFLAISLLSRAALLFQARHEVLWNPSLLAAFACGLWYDLLAACYATVPWFLLTLLLPARLWRSNVMPWLLALITTVYAVVLVFIAVAEWFFWDEFQVRFNFIAVDYLVYTQEVIDNIQQSYPMPLIFSGLGVAGVLISGLLWKTGAVRWVCQGDAAWKHRILPVLTMAFFAVGIASVCSQSQLPRFSNEFNRELAKNGPYAFCAAFWESEIDYERFYLKHEPDNALARARSLLTLSDTPPASADTSDLRRIIKHDGPEQHRNIVLISVESLSADYLRHFKQTFKIKSWLTPNLDRIADEGIFFTNLYATGTRTVRGLEALTLSVPPTPGQSIVWRPGNADMFSIGSVCRDRGYDTSYVYGGDAMFDNMRSFFSANGYRVVDRGTKSKADITFQNAWGVADEDLFRWSMQEADANAAANKPFFMHVMTVSNHRPFTYPEGRISKPQGSRDGAVMYTDYAIGKFLDEAKSKPWFDNTIFIIVADHCSNSAGKVELDVTKYHIPCVIWNPHLIKPRVYDGLCSQIDVVPTVFGLLNWSYTTRFFGQDVFSPGYTAEHQRAYVSNYQKIAFITRDTLAMLKPKQQFTLGRVNLKTGALDQNHNEQLRTQLDDTIALYQSASWLFRNQHLRSDTTTP